MLAIALNRIYFEILKQQINEIVDFFLQMETLSYKVVVTLIRRYIQDKLKGSNGFWSALAQFTYTKICRYCLHRYFIKRS